eukprot:CAMPEP_0194704978 /NCGR_PEP_ID=MMETSP0295-20121207/28643_1 /TAXON_ID=39354 /ORGANISM="Heterosigma akashiwo, Strain CCMP2393" /LENGTH=348 /DNA_ID=CAMNT_0039600543 /DNA_START=92 /DNA_END=1138 /DNA_ORIENTATION=-
MDGGNLGAKKFYGYQGFKSWAHQDLPSLPPGESNETRNSKFANAGHGVVYAKPASSMSAPGKTIALDTTSAVRPSDFKVPDKRGVSANFSQKTPWERSKPFVGASLYQSTFRNFAEDILNIHDYTLEEYQAAFNRIDADGNGFINLREMQGLLTSVHGPQCPGWVAEKFMKFFDGNADGRVTWEEFAQSLDNIKGSVAEDTRLRGRTDPTWLTASRKVYPQVTKHAIKSAYQQDLGMAGEDPRTRPYTSSVVPGMATTTLDLAAGTPGDTHHLPGYGGHIPSKKFGRAGEHSRARGRRRARARATCACTTATICPGTPATSRGTPTTTRGRDSLGQTVQQHQGLLQWD